MQGFRVGGCGALLLVRELLLGPKRFTDLRTGLPGISPNVLTQRLTELEQVAVARRRKLAPPAGVWVYELTDWGKELEPVIIQLGRWGARSPALLRDAELSVDSLILSFRTMFDTDPNTLAALVYDGRDLAQALRSGKVKFEGDKSAVKRFLTLFSLPEPASSN